VTATDDAVGELALADEALTGGDVDGAVARLSAAIRGFTAAGNCRSAAMTCAQLGSVFANHLGNATAARAWFARATRLLESEPPCIEQGWVAVAAMGCDVDDPAELLAKAELALDRAHRFGDVNLETKALADAGLAHVQAGRVTKGMALLEEAMALACGPAKDHFAASQSVCSFLTACYFTADFDRAGSWADLLRRQGLIGSAPGGQAFLSSHCDSVQATLLMELGRWTEAEAVLLRAIRDFEAVMHSPSWHAAIALADLRVRQGRLAEAEALLVGKDASIQALLPMARLHLHRGDVELARTAARRGLRAMADDRLRATELLALLVDADLAAGDLAAAEVDAEELERRAGGLDVPVLRARSAAGRARVLAAGGDHQGAVAVLEETVDGLDPARSPWLRATLQAELAGQRAAAGDRAGGEVDARAAAAQLGGLDVVVPDEVAAVLDALLRRPSSSARPAAGTASLRRDGRWWYAEAAGSTVRFPDTKGLRYLAELVLRPGVERHALDLVDRVEGVAAAGEAPDRRRLGDAGPALDAKARAAYRARIERLRADADDALAVGDLDGADRAQAEIDALVAHLAAALGLGGRDRLAASAAERARLNVTRALRAAIARVAEAMPEAGGVLDRRVRTGTWCVFDPHDDDPVRWLVTSGGS
jgi:tetratricopeptide (TPR) repeat protein